VEASIENKERQRLYLSTNQIAVLWRLSPKFIQDCILYTLIWHNMNLTDQTLAGKMEIDPVISAWEKEILWNVSFFTQ
jgi:hypothetical protein